MLSITGKCKHTSFFIKNALEGGWRLKCTSANIYTDSIPIERVIRTAKTQNMPVALTGEVWQKVGKKGFGELVKPEEAILLVSKLRKLEKVV
jgi:hypothetical protein